MKKPATAAVYRATDWVLHMHNKRYCHIINNVNVSIRIYTGNMHCTHIDYIYDNKFSGVKLLIYAT